MANIVHSRLAWIALIVALVSLASSVMFFTTQRVKLIGINFTGEEDLFGWMFMALSVGAALLALMLGARIKNAAR